MSEQALGDVARRLLGLVAIEQQDDLNAYKGMWVNVWFLKDGTHRKGRNLHESQEKAQEVSNYFFAGKFKAITFNCRNEIIKKEMISHAIPMPVSK